MSFSFYVRVPQAPDYRAVMRSVGLSDIRCEEGEPTKSSASAGANKADRGKYGKGEGAATMRVPWPPGIRHFYRPGLSARGAEVSYEKGTFQVRILTLSAPEDYDLAMRLAEAVARLAGVKESDPEDDDPFPIEELRSRYGDEWVRNTNRAGLAVVRTMAGEDKTNTLTLSGPVRPFHLGQRLLGELEAAGPEDELLDRLIQAMRSVQNVDEEEYYFANVMEAKKGEEEDAPKITFTAFGPGVRYLLPDVKYLVLVGEEGEEPLFLPAEKLPELLPEGNWSWLDEKQMLVEPIDEDDWPEFLERAQPFTETPLEN